MFPTWFRTLCLAYLDWGLGGDDLLWRFPVCPRMQFLAGIAPVTGNRVP